MVSLVIDDLRNQNLLNYPRSGNFDGFVKSPDAALRFILRHCGVRQSTPQMGTDFKSVRAPCLRPFYEAVPFSRLLRPFTRSAILI
jgi:hypothetical protein